MWGVVFPSKSEIVSYAGRCAVTWFAMTESWFVRTSFKTADVVVFSPIVGIGGYVRNETYKLQATNYQLPSTSPLAAEKRPSFAAFDGLKTRPLYAKLFIIELLCYFHATTKGTLIMSVKTNASLNTETDVS